MKLNKNLSMTIIMGTFIAMLVGCEKEGPVEKAGKSVDDAIDKTGQQFEKAGEKIQDAAKDDKK